MLGVGLLLIDVGLAGCATKGTAWSPDGSHLAVAYGGQLYLVAADGSGVTRITREAVILDGPGESAVAWLPEGAEVAFTRGQEIWIADVVTGHERRLGIGSNPAWSPDGERIAYVVQSDQGSEVWLSDPTGRARQHVGTVSSPLFSYQPIDWSPDGTRIAIGGPDGLVMIGVWDGTSRVLDASDASSPDWSPDGLRIAYAGGTPSSLTIVSVRDGTRESPASDGAEPEDQAQAITSHDMKPVWSPDGRRIAFIRNETPAIVDLATGAVTTVPVGLSAVHLAWSPAGRTLAVVTSTDDAYAVVLVSPEGGGSHVLASIPRFARETAERGAENRLVLPAGMARPGDTVAILVRLLPAPIPIGAVTNRERGSAVVEFRMPDLPPGAYQLYVTGDGGHAWLAELLVAPGGSPMAPLIAWAGWCVALSLVLAGRHPALRRQSSLIVAVSALLLAGSVLVAALAFPALLLLAVGLRASGLAGARGAGGHSWRGYNLAAVGALTACLFVCLGLVSTSAAEPSDLFTFSWWPWLGISLGLLLLLGGVGWHGVHALYRRGRSPAIEAAMLVASILALSVVATGWAHAGALVWPAVVVAFAFTIGVHAALQPDPKVAVDGSR